MYKSLIKRSWGCGLWICCFACERYTCLLPLRSGQPWEGSLPSCHHRGPRCQSIENTEHKKIQLIQYGYQILWWCLHRWVSKASASLLYLSFTVSHAYLSFSICFLLVNILCRKGSGLLFTGFIAPLFAHCPSDHTCGNSALLSLCTDSITHSRLILIQRRCIIKGHLNKQ